MPEVWKNAWITCVPKRTVQTPKDVRPIALQCAMGKAVLRVLVDRAKTEAYPKLAPWPIFAYMAGRSTEQALLRVHAHLRKVRECCAFMVTNIWTKHAGIVKPRCRGGLNLSLDLSNAFDTVERSRVAEGLRLAEISKDLMGLMLSWLNNIEYVLQHKGRSVNIPVKRGIRQGCVASPFLWLMWTLTFFSHLQEARSFEWIRRHLTVYADDLVSQWLITGVEDFLQTLQDVGTLLNVLETLKLQVSLNKSVVLLRLAGASCKALLKKHTCRVDGKMFLRIPRGSGKVSLLPLVQKHKYLGTMLSYFNPEDSTLRYRMQCGKLAFFRLSKFLGFKAKTPLSLKMRLWKQCVMSSYVYGLFPTGLTAAGCSIFEKGVFLDWRRLTGKWGHLTHVSNLELAQYLKHQTPLEDLQVRWHDHLTRVTGAMDELPDFDFLHCLDLHEHWEEMRTILACNLHEKNLVEKPATSNRVTEHWPCTQCQKSDTCRPALRRHLAMQHPQIEEMPVFDPLRDSLHGLPQCRHCDLKLFSRSSLKLHIEKKWCTKFDAQAVSAEPVSTSEFVKQPVLTESWRILLNDRDLCSRLANHCCLCNQWCSAAKGIVAHLRREHRESFAASLALRAPIRRILRIGTHCEACGVAVKNEHTCPVTTQLAVLAHHHGGQAPMIDLASPRPSSETTPDAGKRKSPFDGPYVEEQVGPKLDARRDCRGGHNICNHCGQSYSDHIGLKRHIENSKCPRFDAELAPQTWILAYRAPVIEMFHLMQPESWLQERDLLQRMRNECVLCGRRFVNGQLNMHLAQEHLADVHKADSWAKHLQDYYQPHGAACLCGSWHSFNNAQHVCPVATQIGILRNVAKANLEPPGTGTVPRLLDSWIMEEDYEKAWRHPDYTYVFGQYCSLCLNRTPSLEALWLHFEEFHASMLPEALVMYDRLLHDFPNCCSACSVMPREAFSVRLQ